MGRKSSAGSGVAAGCPGEGIPAVPIHLSKEHGTMQTVLDPRGDARTYLTHFVGGGLDDDRYVVQRFRSLASGDIVPVRADVTKQKGRSKARGTFVPLKAVEKMRPARDEIIIATGVKLRDCGVQLWGWRSLGLFVDRRQTG